MTTYQNSREGYYNNKPDNIIPGSLTTRILEKEEPLHFHAGLPGYSPTPILMLEGSGSPKSMENIFIKDESHRFGLKSFKVLGASYAINKILKKRPGALTLCTATDGNHGRAVGWSASRDRRLSRVFVPEGTSDARIAAIEEEGAIVSVFNGNYDETCRYAMMESSRNGWELIQDTAFKGYEEIPALIMAGYTTIFRELEDSLNKLPDPMVDIIFLQAGVGSFAASACWYYLNRYGTRRPRIVIVEPEESDGILASFINGYPSAPSGSLNTIMAGLNCGIPSISAWEIIKHVSDAVINVDDSYAVAAMRILFNNKDCRITAGESGAAGLAGLLRLLDDRALKPVKDHIGLSNDSRILLVNTEGDTDPESFNMIVGG